MTFVRKPRKAIVACDFFVVVTATFRVLSVLSSWKLDTQNRAPQCHGHPTAEWTLQQFGSVYGRPQLPLRHP